MKPVSPELLTLLATRQFYCADLYTFSGGNLGANILRYTSGDQDLVVNGWTYLCGGQTGPYFDRKSNKAKIHSKIGLEVDTLTFDLLPGSATYQTITLLQAMRLGMFDGATLLFEKVFMPTYGDTRVGVVRQFVGRVGALKFGRSVATITINSTLELLNIQLPRNLYSASCVNKLGDKGCGVNLTSYKTTGTVTGTPTRATMNATLAGGPFSTGQFNQGKVVFTSGVFNGWQVSVSTYVNPVITFVGTLGRPPAAGDTFIIYYGCDRTSDGVNGCAKFSNFARFRGFPRIPAPSTAV